MSREIPTGHPASSSSSSSAAATAKSSSSAASSSSAGAATTSSSSFHRYETHQQLDPYLSEEVPVTLQQHQQQQQQQQQPHQPSVLPPRHLGPLPLHQQQLHQQQQQQSAADQQPPGPGIHGIGPPMLEPLQSQGYYHRSGYIEHGTSGKLDKFDSLLPKAGEERNTLYGHVSRTLGRTLTSPSDAPSTASSSKSLADLESSSDSVGVSSRAEKPAKICEVCGDRAKSFHFGGVSCDSCKAFFRRAVHNDNYNSFRCAYSNACVINISNRKTCQACRFKKCIQIGMEKKWIMTEEERSLLQKQRLEKKQKKASKSGETVRSPPAAAGSASGGPSPARAATNYEPDVSTMLRYMTSEDQEEIEGLVRKFHQSYKDIPYKVSQSSTSRNSIEIIEMFTTILRRMVYFHKNLPDFNELCQEDQSTLLRQSVLEMCMLRSALTYDFKNNRWPVQTGSMEFLRSCPILKVEDMKKLVSADLYKMQMEFISGIQELQADEPIVVLLSLIVLFYPDRTGLLHPEIVTAKQEKYLQHLQNYIQWRFGPHSSKMYARFLTKLSDLRQLNDSHNEYNLRLAQQEVNQIQEQLSAINLNPYTQWDLVKYDREKTVGPVEVSQNHPQTAEEQARQQPQRNPSQCTTGTGEPMQYHHTDEHNPGPKMNESFPQQHHGDQSVIRSHHSQQQQQAQSPKHYQQQQQHHHQNYQNLHKQNQPDQRLQPSEQQPGSDQVVHNHHSTQPSSPPPLVPPPYEPLHEFENADVPQKSMKHKPSFVGVLFSKMVNRTIPLLMKDPMATLSTDEDIADVTRYFGGSAACKIAKMSCSSETQQSQAQLITATSPVAFDPDSFSHRESVATYGSTRIPASSTTSSTYTVGYNNNLNLSHQQQQQLPPQQQQNRPPNNESYCTTIKSILDSLGAIDDPTVLEKIKQSLSPAVLRQLRDTFAAGSPELNSLAEAYAPTPPRTPSNLAMSPPWGESRARTDEVNHVSPHQHHHHQPQQQQQLASSPPNPLISDQIQDILQSFGYQQRRGQDSSVDGGYRSDDHHVISHSHPQLPERQNGQPPPIEPLVESPTYPQDCTVPHSYQPFDPASRDFGGPDPRYQQKGLSHSKYPW